MNKRLNTSDYIVRKVDNKYVFLNFSNGDSHLLDEVGTLFLDLYLKQDDEITILGEINKIYPKVPVETVKNDFNEFIESAFQKGLLI